MTRPHIAIIAFTAILATVLLASCASSTMATGDLGKTRETSAGKVLVDAKGMTLYTYDKDAPGKSNCSGMCATFWPPAEAAPGAKPQGNFTLVDRGGQTRQWAYKGMPLYGYLRDDKPGDVSGDGADGVWHVVHP